MGVALVAVALAPAASPRPAGGPLATTPPLGWNSWDCWGGPGDQQRLYAAAAAFADSLLPAGYDTMVVDMGWYFEQSDASMCDPDAVRTTLVQGRL